MRHPPIAARRFFLEFAAKQIAIYRGLGFRGVYLGGVHNFPAIEKILEIERSFAPDDWKQFAREIRFSRPGEFFYYAENPATGLADPQAETPRPEDCIEACHAVYQTFQAGRTPRCLRPARRLRTGARRSARMRRTRCRDRSRCVRWKKLSKAVLYHCKDCGDCSLPDIAYLCPESQCAKNQRNGPCGGTREGRCEVDGYGDCIWLRAYERLKHDGREQKLLDHVPVVQNQGLRGTSAWANLWLGRDHTSKRKAH